MQIDSSTVAPRLSITPVPFTDKLFNELRASVKGPIYRPSDPEYAERTRTFNGKLESFSKVVVSPLDAQDTSAVVRFCVKHGLSPSVRAGGYGIAGWAVAGNVIVDLSMMRGVDIETPREDVGEDEADWTKLNVTPSLPVSIDSTRDGSALQETSNSLKRRREDSPSSDQQLRSYDNASPVVAAFLHGAPLPVEVGGEKPREPPTNKPRLHSPEPETARPVADDMSRQMSGDSSSSGDTGATDRSGTAATTPSRGSPKPETKDTANTSSRDADPFGYMSAGPSQVPVVMFGGRGPFSTASSASVIPSFTPGTLNSSSRPWLQSTSSSVPPMFSSFASSALGSFAPAGGNPSQSQVTRGISSARPVHKHVYITFAAGMRQKEVDQYAANHPFDGIGSVSGIKEAGVIPYYIPSAAHPAGSSFILLAGFGFLSRLHGLSIDHLVEMEMVLADGRTVVINKDEDPDLWWAVRGAGPAFGIATRYKARAFPVPVVFAGNLIYRFHRATAPSLIKHFRDCIKGVPRELYANVILTAGPVNKDSLVVIQICYIGPKEKGMEYLQAIASWDGERCLLNEVHEKSFLNQQDSVAQVLRGKIGRQWFIRSSLIHSLPDEVINQTVLQFADTPIGCTWLFELAGGAIVDYEDTCLPKEQREATWTVAAFHQWDMGIDDPRCVTTAEEWMDTVIKPVSLGGPYPTFLGRHEPPTRTMACYGKNWTRLAELKRKYDPHCLFKNNFWPLNKDGEPIGFLENEPPSPEMTPVDL